MQLVRTRDKSDEVGIVTGNVRLEGQLVVPATPEGLVVFAHGSGSTRHSPRNQHVARELRNARLGTLLFDLLTPDEEHAERHTRHLRFDVDLLAERVVGAIDWVLGRAEVRGLRVGVFGASTGAAAALVAAAQRPRQVGAVVSRGGRPDLAGAWLGHVRAPALLLVGANDPRVLELNRAAHEELVCTRTLKTVEGASHLFEEPGALEQVSRLASDWFRQHLSQATA